jgi:hypothetical protein
MSYLAANLAWNAAVRLLLFWALIGGALFGLAQIAPHSDWQLIFDAIIADQHRLLEMVTQEKFAFALASAIVQFGLALGFAFLIAHVLLICAALSVARRALGSDGDPRSFAAAFDGVSQKLRRNALIGRAWREFERTLVRTNVVQNTVRPQSFINLAHARERLFGLKMMASIPGYFVGLGLLLTFIGLVLALNKAAGSTTAGSATAMTQALNGLLDAATFKFSTSIAGLGASLLLSLLFRTYQIWIEGAFDRFSGALEDRLQFQPPQRLAAESVKLLVEQRDQLKEINSEAFFNRLGDSIAPRFQTAVTEAISPVSSSLDDTMKALTRTSQTGVEDLINRFMGKLDQGAGQELGRVIETLASLQAGLEAIRESLSGSGQVVSDRLAAAAESLSGAAANAGTSLSDSATGAAGKIESIMEQLAEKLDAQNAVFGDRMAALQNAVAEQMEKSGSIAQKAGEAAADASKRAADEAVEAMRTAMGEVTQSLSADISRLSATLQTVENAFRVQTQHIDAVSSRSRETATVFGEVAANVRSASQPLVDSSERVAKSASSMATSIAGSVDTLTATQRTASGIAERLDSHLEEIRRVWDGIGGVWNEYEARFNRVDEALGRAMDRFQQEVSNREEAVGNFVIKIDEHLSTILGKISNTVSGLDETLAELTEALGQFPPGGGSTGRPPNGASPRSR